MFRAQSSGRERAKYLSHYVAFLDILGWKKIVAQIETEVSRFDEIMAAYNSILSQGALDAWGRQIYSEGPRTEGFLDSPKHTIASDAIILSVPEDDGALINMVLRSVQLIGTLLAHGFLVRGAIALGPLYHEVNIVFGKGLTDAYLLEREKAVYPRVLAQPIIRERILGGRLNGPWGQATASNWFRQDDDGQWRLNSFASLGAPEISDPTEFFEAAAKTIMLGLTTNEPGSGPFEKVVWLGRAYNSELAHYQKKAMIKRSITPIDLTAFRA